jgi:site-specific recombinase XerD
MIVAQVSQEKSPDRLPFHPPENQPSVTGNFRLQDGHLEKWLKQWGERHLFGGPYLKEYLEDRKRRNCRPATLRGYFSTLTVFMSYLKERGRTSLDTITREDLSSFIEHQQDRGRQPTTVSTRLRLLYAFLGYLVDREVVPPEVLKRKLRVKVPETLPRAMDPEGVRELLAVIKRCRDQALILVLLRTGMRIGELLATRMSDVNLRERQILIMEAQKTRVGRVAYLSEDACRALAEWVNLRDPAKERLFYGQGRLSLGYTAVRNIWRKPAWPIRAIVCIASGTPAPLNC